MAGADILRHATSLTEPLIAVLAALKPELRSPALVTDLLRNRDRAEESARQWTWRLGRLRASAPEAAAAIEAAVRGGAALEYLLDADGPGVGAPIPPPPWPGTARLRPLATPAAMMDAAKRYNNCLLSRIESVRDGRQFYYELDGEPGMIVQLERDPPFGWKVDNVRLARNQQPSAEAMRGLAAELDGSEVFYCPAQEVEEEEEDGIQIMIHGRRRRRGG